MELIGELILKLIKKILSVNVLYFTGSAYFNRSMRLLSRYLCLYLSDKKLSIR